MTTDKRVTIKIPRQLYDKLKVMIGDTGFSSVNEFIVYVMRDVASAGKLDQDIGLSRQEIDLIRKRLIALGYVPDDRDDVK